MKTKLYSIVLSIFIGISLVLSIIKITVSTAYTTAGVELSSLDTTIKQLQKDNALLSEQIYQQSSLFTIASRAATLGFEENKTSQIIINSPLPVAYNQ